MEVDWAPDEVLRTALKQDLDDSMNRPTNVVRDYESTTVRGVSRKCWRRAVIPVRAPTMTPSTFPALVEEFYRETGYPTDAHEEQERLRERMGTRSSRPRMSAT